MVSRWLDPLEERAWRSYRRMFTLLEGRLAAELSERTGLSMADYTVLSNLVEAADRRWRITELAEHMQWSQSRLSHQIRRMENRDLVKREEVAEDGRGAAITLTNQGAQVIAQAAPLHFAGVRAHMIDVLTEHQLAALGDIADAVVAHLQDASERGDE
jgi:DNA-binding MarR family transcriptional regulator